jgi:hypothetical protein
VITFSYFTVFYDVLSTGCIGSFTESP